MTIRPQNSVPFLRVQRLFPQEAQPLSVEIDRSYTDIANAVNNRVIGLFALQSILATGERWGLDGINYPGLRSVYRFTAAGSIPHGITGFFNFSPRSYGVFSDGVNFYGVPFASSVTIAGQVTFYVTPTNIVILSGAGAPAISSGLIVLEWLSQA